MQENMYVLSIEMEDFRHGRTKQRRNKTKAKQNKAKQNKNTHHTVHRIGISKAKNRQTKAINK